jgi:hypothetical protein
MSPCTHDFVERELAVTADGYCPLCQAAQLATLRANHEDLRHNCSRLNEANERLRSVLTNLVVQVDRSNAVDDHGHELKNLAALADAREALGK